MNQNPLTAEFEPQVARSSGVERDPAVTSAAPAAQFWFAPGRFRLIQVVLNDQTDAHAELVQEIE